jgi:excinuclease UvrABC nuclease subunit
LYGYVKNTLVSADFFGLAPTDKWLRDYIREILGSNCHDGGAYFFKTADDSWYIGKADDLYRRLRGHLGTGKLNEEFIDTLGAIINPNGSPQDHFKLENELMEIFRDEYEVDLSNKINSPGKNCP